MLPQFLPCCHEYLVVWDIQIQTEARCPETQHTGRMSRRLVSSGQLEGLHGAGLESQGLNWHIRFITPLQAKHQAKIGLELGRIDATKWLNPKFVVIMIGVCQLSITHGTLWGCECFDQNTQPADTKICPKLLSVLGTVWQIFELKSFLHSWAD